MLNDSDFDVNQWEISFGSSVAFTIIFGALAAAWNIIMIIVLFKAKHLIQRHVKWLLINASIVAAIYSLTQFSKFVSYAVKFQMGISLTVSAYQCALENLVISHSSVNFAISVVSIACERLVATYCYRNYERSKKPLIRTLLPILLVCWSVPTVSNVVGLLLLRKFENATIPFCSTVLAVPSKSLIAFYVVEICIGIASTTSFIVVILTNRKRLLDLSYNQAQLSLSGRFQLRNNIDISKTLLPSAVLHLLIYIVADCAFLFVNINGEMKINKRASIVLVMNSLKTLHLMLHPLSTLLSNRRLRAAVVWILLRKKLTTGGARVAPITVISHIETQPKLLLMSLQNDTRAESVVETNAVELIDLEDSKE